MVSTNTLVNVIFVTIYETMWQMIIVGNISFSPCCSFFVRFMSHMSWMRKERDKSGGIFKRVMGSMIQYIDFISTKLDIYEAENEILDQFYFLLF